MCNCLCSVSVLCGMMMMKGREKVNPVPTHCCSPRKAPRGPPGLTSPSDGRIAINSTICLLNIHTAEGFGIESRTVMYDLAFKKCTSPPLLAPRLKIFKLKFTTPPGSNPEPAEPKADMITSEPARRTF